jgi:hypothetical protein
LEGFTIECHATLKDLEKILSPRKTETKKIGFRELTWPFIKSEVEGIMTDLENFKSTIKLFLIIDNTWVFQTSSI